MDPFLGQISIFGCNYAPMGWALCEGQVLAINQYTALFSLLGTNFGGNGTTNFQLPDLRSRAPLGIRSGSGSVELYHWSNWWCGHRNDQCRVLPGALAYALCRRQQCYQQRAGRSSRG